LYKLTYTNKLHIPKSHRSISYNMAVRRSKCLYTHESIALRFHVLVAVHM